MTLMQLENPNNFTMSDFLPLFSYIMVQQQSKFVEKSSRIDELCIQRRHLIDCDPFQNSSQNGAQEKSSVTPRYEKNEAGHSGLRDSIAVRDDCLPRQVILSINIL